jgi:hypothetical protein
MLRILIIIVCGYFSIEAKPHILTAQRGRVNYEYKNPYSIRLGPIKAKNTLCAMLAPSCGHCYHFVNRTLTTILDKYPKLGIEIVLNPLNFIDMEISKIIFSHKNPFNTLKFFLEHQDIWIRPYLYAHSIEDKKDKLRKYNDISALTNENDEFMFLKLFLMEENPPFLNPDLEPHQKQLFIKNTFDISKYVKECHITRKITAYQRATHEKLSFTPIFFLDGVFLGKGVDVEDKLEELFDN